MSHLQIPFGIDGFYFAGVQLLVKGEAGVTHPPKSAAATSIPLQNQRQNTWAQAKILAERWVKKP